MKLVKLQASYYRSLRDVAVGMKELNVFIGANASGKSNVLDVLRFLHEGVRDRDFGAAMRARGGILHLTWKGEEAQETALSVEIAHGDDRYDWWLRFIRDGYEFHVEEQIHRRSPQSPPAVLLDVGGGVGGGGPEKTANVSKSSKLRQGAPLLPLPRMHPFLGAMWPNSSEDGDSLILTRFCSAAIGR